MTGTLQKISLYFFPNDYSTLRYYSWYLSQEKNKILRLVLTLIAIGCFVISQIDLTPAYADILYLTLWGITFTCIYFVISSFEIIYEYFTQRPLYSSFWKLRTIMFFLAFINEFTITVLYWSVLFPNEIQKHKPSPKYIFFNISYHFMPYALLWVDFIFNSIIVNHWRHLIYIVVVDILYFVVNVTYSLVVQPVYSPVTYHDVMTYVYIAFAFISLGIQYWIAKYVYIKLKQQKTQSNQGLRESLLSEE